MQELAARGAGEAYEESWVFKSRRETLDNAQRAIASACLSTCDDNNSILNFEASSLRYGVPAPQVDGLSHAFILFINPQGFHWRHLSLISHDLAHFTKTDLLAPRSQRQSHSSIDDKKVFN